MNPFKYGVIVNGNYFTNRTKEKKEISADIEAGQHIVLISPRRYGKSSLITAIMQNSKLLHFTIDLQILTSEIDFANFYIKKALSLSRFEKFKHYLKNLHIQPALQINPENNDVTVSFNTNQADKAMLLADCLDFPEKIARNLKKRIVIVFDEFQDIRRISSRLEKQMRAIFQHHTHVTYIFIGSQESMIRDIFQNKKNPFYKFGRQITLDIIERSEFKTYIKRRFQSQKIDANSILNEILDFTRCHPYYTQQLCYDIFYLTENKSLKSTIINKAITKIIAVHHSDYLYWWSKLTNTERKILIGIVSGDYHVTSNDFIRKYDIKSSSTAGSALKKLFEAGIIIRINNNLIQLEDPFWVEWIINKREM